MAIESYADTFLADMLSRVQSNLERRVGSVFWEDNGSVFVAFATLPVGTPVILIDDAFGVYATITGVTGGHSSGGSVIDFDPIPTSGNYIMVGPVMQETVAAPYVKAGTTKVTTEAGLIEKEDSKPEMCFVDFEGSYLYGVADRGTQYGCPVNPVVTKFRDFYIMDSSTDPSRILVTFDHNTNPLFCDGTCPGVACIEVTSPNDDAAIAGYMCKGYLGTTYYRIKQGFRFWIDSENDETDEIQVSIGFTNGKDGYVDGDGPLMFMPGFSFHYNYKLPRDADGRYPIEVIETSDSMGAGPALWTQFPAAEAGKWPSAGRWISVDMYYDRQTDTGQVTFNGITAPISIGKAFEYFGPGAIDEILPMLYVKKKRGSRPMKVYVDYLYYGTEPV